MIKRDKIKIKPITLRKGYNVFTASISYEKISELMPCNKVSKKNKT